MYYYGCFIVYYYVMFDSICYYSFVLLTFKLIPLPSAENPEVISLGIPNVISAARAARTALEQHGYDVGNYDRNVNLVNMRNMIHSTLRTYHKQMAEVTDFRACIMQLDTEAKAVEQQADRSRRHHVDKVCLFSNKINKTNIINKT